MKICMKCDEPINQHKPNCQSWDAYMRREGYKEYKEYKEYKTKQLRRLWGWLMYKLKFRVYCYECGSCNNEGCGCWKECKGGFLCVRAARGEGKGPRGEIPCPNCNPKGEGKGL